MKLVLYSGGGGRENQVLARESAAMLTGKKNPTLAFVPADGTDATASYRQFKRDFTKTGVKKFRCIPVDHALTKKQERELLASDAIFLGGGNTFYFLKSLRARGLIPKLRAYAKRGGILLGLSAGSILLTPRIKTASVPSIDSDENEVGIRNLNALGLVPFEFSPHYVPSRQADSELLRYSRALKNPIYACADGHGIVVRDGSIRFVGKVKVFHNGRTFSL